LEGVKRCKHELRRLYGGNRDFKSQTASVDEGSDADEHHGSDDGMEEHPISAWCPIVRQTSC
jgi:hypothetical protein